MTDEMQTRDSVPPAATGIADPAAGIRQPTAPA